MNHNTTKYNRPLISGSLTRPTPLAAFTTQEMSYKNNNNHNLLVTNNFFLNFSSLLQFQLKVFPSNLMKCTSTGAPDSKHYFTSSRDKEALATGESKVITLASLKFWLNVKMRSILCMFLFLLGFCLHEFFYGHFSCIILFVFPPHHFSNDPSLIMNENCHLCSVSLFLVSNLS